MILNGLTLTDYVIVVLVYVEAFLAFGLRLIPAPIYRGLAWIISRTANDGPAVTIQQRLRDAATIHEMCEVFGITIEDHLVRTEDDYVLTLHRIPPRADISSTGSPPRVVYLHHGLLMCSDVWCSNIERDKNLPFVLHDLGFDVWMGNNRGNKYSTAHISRQPRSEHFWDFSIDEFAFFDIPNSIQFILDLVHQERLICIGFSQGSAQMFAAFSLSPELNRKVSHFIAIAPAMTPKRLHNPVVDVFAKSSPELMYLFFGRKIILPSAVVWQRTVHPTIFNILIDIGNRVLFNWHAQNISPEQKLVSYSKLYSTTSVKSIVHWFQILRSQRFQMFEESDNVFNSLTRPYQIATFPTKTNISIPILLMWGGTDSLVDINVMKRNLPRHNVFDVEVKNHEHLDLLWGKDIDQLVISKVLRFIEFFSLKESQSVPSPMPQITRTTSSFTHRENALSALSSQNRNSITDISSTQPSITHKASESPKITEIVSGIQDNCSSQEDCEKREQRRLTEYLDRS